MEAAGSAAGGNQRCTLGGVPRAGIAIAMLTAEYLGSPSSDLLGIHVLVLICFALLFILRWILVGFILYCSGLYSGFMLLVLVVL